MLSDRIPHLQLAPFQGITTLTYREVYSRHFPFLDKLFTPFFTNIQTAKGLSHRTTELNILDHHKIPVIPQILSKDPEEMIRFARYCEQKGHQEINWNMGCPFPRVAKKQRGSGLLSHPDLVEEILNALSGRINIRLSVKCRLGYENPDEIFSLIPLFNSFGVSELIIHARIGKQLYKGPVDLHNLKQINEELSIPLVYNGDIFSVVDLLHFQQLFPFLNRFMIGRGLLIDPLLPARMKNIRFDNARWLVQRFMEDLYIQYRKDHHDRLHILSILKELWSLTSLGFTNPARVFGRVKKSKSFDEFEEAMATIFSQEEWIGTEGQHLERTLNGDTV